MVNNREKTIIKTSIIGIAANVFLSAFKAAVGIISNSIAVILDAVNNLSDALSSLVTIIGTKLASRNPDKKHPLGHGRIEYVTAMFVAALILYAGFTSLIESIKKIITPEEPDYSVVSLIIIAVAVVIKLFLGLYVRKTGKKVNSSALEASGKDALFDAVISFSVLASAIIFFIFRISLEAYVGVIISIFIIKAGIEILLEAVGDILGRRADSEYTDEIKKTILSDPEVSGVYDLILNNYGPDRYIGSVHVAVDDTLTADRIDAIQRRISAKVYENHGIIMTAVGIYAVNTSDDEARRIQDDITRDVMSRDGVLQIHGFYIEEKTKSMSFDVILDIGRKDRKEIYDRIVKDIREKYPDYSVNIVLDLDI